MPRITIPLSTASLDIAADVQAYINANLVVMQFEIPAHPLGAGNRWPWRTTCTLNRLVDIAGEGNAEEPGEGGTWLEMLIDNMTPVSFFCFTTGSRGSKLHNLSLYQGGSNYHTWTGVDSGFISSMISKWAAAPAAVVVYNTFGAVTIDKVHFAMCGRGVSVYGAGRTRIGDITGCFMEHAVLFDNCTDVVYVGSIHAWVWFTDKTINANIPESIVRWQTEHLQTLIFNRCDGAKVESVFCLNAYTGVTLSNSEYGGATNIVIDHLYADFTRFGIFFSNSQAGDLTINKFTHYAEDFWTGGGAMQPYSNAIDFNHSNNNQLRIGTVRCQGTGQSIVHFANYGPGGCTGNIIQLEYVWCPNFGANPVNGVALFEIPDSVGTHNFVYINGVPFYNPPTGPKRTPGSVNTAFIEGVYSGF